VVAVIDPFSVPPSPESKMVLSHHMQLILQRIAICLSDALALAQPGWDTDIFFLATQVTSWYSAKFKHVSTSKIKTHMFYFLQ
jgi:hypothetical protein